MTVRSWMSSITDIITSKHLGLFTFELVKIAELDFVYTLASKNIYYVYALVSTNINQSVPNLVKMNTTERSMMSVIMDLIDL